jgi:c(7)-type cytochrome triheme protein
VTASIRAIAALLTVPVLVHLDACAPHGVKPAAKEAPPPPAQPAAPAVRPAQAAPDQDLYYDPANPAYATLQKANQALAGFPLDATGKVDWMQALRSGLIQPRQDLNGTSQMTVLELDVIMKNTREMPYVLFPHRAHTLWLDCSNCHPAIFEARAGAARITMNDIFRGKYCGTCHDRVAFVTYFSCERCHRVARVKSEGAR